MADVFLSYAFEDRPRMESFVALLEAEGLTVWWDRRIAAGSSFDQVIEGELDRASCVVVAWSTHSIRSEWVRNEATDGANRGILIPIAIDEVRLPLAFRGRQTASLVGWPAGMHTDTVTGVLATIRSIVERGADISGESRSENAAPITRKSATGRIFVAFASSDTGDGRAAVELANAIARYVSWDGGPFRAIATGPLGRYVDRSKSDYLVEVSVRKLEQFCRVEWRLCATETDEIVWANEHSELPRAFVDKRIRIAEMIGEGVLRNITDLELRRIAKLEPQALSYAQLVLKGGRFSGVERDRVEQRCDLLNRAIALEPDTGLAHALLADILSWKAMNAVDATGTEVAQREAQRALELDPNDPAVLLNVGQTHCRIGHYDEGLALIRRAVTLAPTAKAKDELAKGLCFAGQPDEAIGLFEDILSTMPAGHTFRYGRLAVALTQAGRLADALEFSSRDVIHFASDFYAWVVHANLLAQLDRVDEARRAVAQARWLVPKLNLEAVIAKTADAYGRSETQREHLTAGLRRLAKSADA